MSESKGSKNIISEVSAFSKTAVQRIKKGDKRFIIMAAAALVLVLLILVLIIHGIAGAGSKKTKNEPSSGDFTLPEITTEDVGVASGSVSGKPGMYKVNTNSESPLNMRLAADRTTEKIGSIPHETVVEVLFVDDSSVSGPDDYAWAYVEYNSRRGWVSMEYLVPAN